MELRKLSPDSPDIGLLRRVNELSFPENERVEITEMFDFCSDGKLNILGIYSAGEFAGFIVIRLFGDLRYIAYFAVSPEKRSQGIGSAALAALRDYYPGCRIAVDIEAPDADCPNNAQRLRRRNFYIRCGFRETGWYQFYMDTEFEIFSSEENFNKELFEAMNADIHSRVPEFDPHLYRRGKE